MSIRTDFTASCRAWSSGFTAGHDTASNKGSMSLSMKRLGMSLVKGLTNDDVARIVAAWISRPFRSVASGWCEGGSPDPPG